MNILDNPTQMQQLDKQNVYQSLVDLPKQCQHAWDEAQKISLPANYKQVNKIVMAGMGGSGLGARIIESVYGLNLKQPLVRINDYDLPSWADEKTLVICFSFSGTTEEIVSISKQAQTKNCPWLAISAGGTIIELVKKHHRPFYRINPVYNPSKQPRMAIGYSVVGQLVMAHKAGLINFTAQRLQALIDTIEKTLQNTTIDLPANQNPAKKLASKFYEKAVVFVAARHMTGGLHTVKNQMNENSKNFSVRFDVPEMNHHLMEGLLHPQSNPKHLLFFLISSQLYPPRISQRMTITQQVVKKNKINTVLWQASAKDKLSQVFELIQFVGMANFYLSMLYKINPAEIPWVDYFKTKLGQPLGK